MERQRAAPDDRSIHDRIKELLVTYAFFPGDRIDVVGLAEQLRVSATPVREALSRLCAEGLLTAMPHRGFFVKKLDQNEVSDLFEMKHMLLSYAVATAEFPALASDECLAASGLAELNCAEYGLARSLETYERYAPALILLVGSLSGNAALVQCLANVLDKLHFVRQVECRLVNHAEIVFQEYVAIAQLVLAKSPKGLCMRLDQQLRREQMMLPELMKECVNRLYLRGQPAPEARARPLPLVRLSA